MKKEHYLLIATQFNLFQHRPFLNGLPIPAHNGYTLIHPFNFHELDKVTTSNLETFVDYNGVTGVIKTFPYVVASQTSYLYRCATKELGVSIIQAIKETEVLFV